MGEKGRAGLGFAGFLEAWWRGPLGISAYREVMVEKATERGVEYLKRARVPLSSLKRLVEAESGEWEEYNWYVSNAFSINGEWIAERAYFDRVTIDIDSSSNPKLAVSEALNLAKRIEDAYGGAPLVVLSGFKGAHVHVFLSKPLSAREYELVFSKLAALMDKKDRDRVDWFSCRWDFLARMPLTYNHKLWDAKVARTKIIYPVELESFEDFSWSLIKPLTRIYD
jgi:hypothetical protein